MLRKGLAVPFNGPDDDHHDGELFLHLVSRPYEKLLFIIITDFFPLLLVNPHLLNQIFELVDVPLFIRDFPTSKLYRVASADHGKNGAEVLRVWLVFDERIGVQIDFPDQPALFILFEKM